MLVKEGLNYRFSHRSFQEYFAAWYTCKLPDDVQQSLLSNWIKESDRVFVDDYFSMLFDLQSDKVTKIILIPALEKIQRKYEKLGFIEFLRKIFKGFKIAKDPETDRFYISLTIRDRYLCYCSLLNCDLNKFVSLKYSNVAVQEIINTYIGKDTEDAIVDTTTISFEKALEAVEETEFLSAVSWFEEQILYAIATIERFKNPAIGRRKKVSSILEEL